MRKLLFLLSLIFFGGISDAVACNGNGFGQTYEEAVKHALANCKSNVQILHQTCKGRNQWLYVSSCDFRGAAMESDGSWQAYAGTLHCECRQ